MGTPPLDSPPIFTFSKLDVDSLFFSFALRFWNHTPIVPGVVPNFSASFSFSAEFGVLVLENVARRRESWSWEGRNRDLRKEGSVSIEGVVREG
jgi:hypothetical protein